MEPDEIVSSPPSEGKAMVFYGAICGNCGFRYAEHEGHIIPCPRCAAADLELRLAAQATSTADSLRTIAELESRLARLEEEKAQVEASLREAKDEVYQATTVAYDERLRCQHAEAREAAKDAALQDVITRMDPDESGLQRAALSPDAGRAPARLPSGYPNLQAALDGCVSGSPSEWLLLKAEFARLAAEVETLRVREAALHNALRTLYHCRHGDEDRCGCRQPAEAVLDPSP